jgi:hypothetical protein
MLLQAGNQIKQNKPQIQKFGEHLSQFKRRRFSGAVLILLENLRLTNYDDLTRSTGFTCQTHS